MKNTNNGQQQQQKQPMHPKINWLLFRMAFVLLMHIHIVLIVFFYHFFSGISVCVCVRAFFFTKVRIAHSQFMTFSV